MWVYCDGICWWELVEEFFFSENESVFFVGMMSGYICLFMFYFYDVIFKYVGFVLFGLGIFGWFVRFYLMIG